MKKSEFLTEVKAVIATPATWATGALARREDGRPVPTSNADAVCFCISGAINKAQLTSKISPSDAWEARFALVAAVRKLMRNQNALISQFNDRHGRQHSEVLALLDSVIKTEKEKEDAAVSNLG